MIRILVHRRVVMRARRRIRIRMIGRIFRRMMGRINKMFRRKNRMARINRMIDGIRVTGNLPTVEGGMRSQWTGGMIVVEVGEIADDGIVGDGVIGGIIIIVGVGKEMIVEMTDRMTGGATTAEIDEIGIATTTETVVLLLDTKDHQHLLHPPLPTPPQPTSRPVGVTDFKKNKKKREKSVRKNSGCEEGAVAVVVGNN